jgi:hypothetical protein
MQANRNGILLALLCITSLVLLPISARAQWSEDGEETCTATGVQQSPCLVSDGAGGAIIAWQDDRDTFSDIYVQRVNGHGDTLWTKDGVALCTIKKSRYAPAIASDGSGGAIVTWYEERTGGNNDIYAQRVDASGVIQWPSGAVALCEYADSQQDPVIASDGEGGAIVAWMDYRSGTNFDVYAQRVDASGAIPAPWSSTGQLLCDDPATQGDLVITSDGVGGAIIAWEDNRNGANDVFAQRIDASGVIHAGWTADGVVVCDASFAQSSPRIISDGAEGAIITWADYRNTEWDVYVQRIDKSGNALWIADGEVMCNASGGQNGPELVSDGEGGAIVVWRDNRNADSDIYARRVVEAGYPQDPSNGIRICTAPGEQIQPTITSDGAGGAVIAWKDYRGGSPDIYARRMTANSAVVWETDGVRLCGAEETQQHPAIVSDGAGGAFVAWEDDRGTDLDVYIQRVTREGHWGYPAPRITSVQDVPEDQGGRVWIEFDASRLDDVSHKNISFYSVWRSLSSPTGIAGLSGAIALDSPEDAIAESAGNSYYETSAGYWQLIGTMEAHLWSGYGYPVSTLRDQSGGDEGWEYYFVTAHTTVGGFWGSPPDSGYSVDNLSPEMLSHLAAEYAGGGDVNLHWNPNNEQDLDHYTIYRGTAAGFVPDETNRLGTATDTCFIDTHTGQGEDHWYKVSAVDVHDNEGPFALLTPDMINGNPGERHHYANALLQNLPNPFHSSTRITFSMTGAGHVRLMVFDAKGRLVRVLVDEVREPNRYVEQWDGRDGNGRPVPAGLYFCTLEAPGWKSSKKMTLAR